MQGFVFVATFGLSLLAESRGYSLAAVCRLLIVVACLIAEHGLEHMGSAVVEYGQLSCPLARGIFLHKRSKPCPLHAGRFLTIEPPGKSWYFFNMKLSLVYLSTIYSINENPRSESLQYIILNTETKLMAIFLSSIK